MVRILTICALAILLSGCSNWGIKTETVTVDRPILYCPAPDYDGLGRPEALPTDFITEETPDGEVAVRYKATVIMLRYYIDRLEQTVDQYKDFNMSYEDLKKQLDLDSQ